MSQYNPTSSFWVSVAEGEAVGALLRDSTPTSGLRTLTEWKWDIIHDWHRLENTRSDASDGNEH